MQLVLFVQSIIATFLFCFSETEYNAVRFINYTILRRCFSFSVQHTEASFVIFTQYHLVTDTQNACRNDFKTEKSLWLFM